MVNLLGTAEIFKGLHNPGLFDNNALNNARGISKIAKKCVVVDNETYISTDDPWKTGYYFGRHSTVEKDSTEARVETIRKFLLGNLSNVVLIHTSDDLIDKDMTKVLKEKSTEAINFSGETVYLYKDCQL